MKKSFRTLTLGLLTVGMLAACNKPAPAPNWSSDDQKTMSDNLYGVVLPYVSLGNLEVKFDSAQDQVVVTGDELESTAIASYAQKFTTADGWTDITPANAAYYSFEKQVNNEAGAKRWVAVQFGNEEYTPASTDGETGPLQSVANEGEATPTKAKRFAMYAVDPYLYEFPADKLYEEVSSMTGGRVITLPNFPADRYDFEYDNNDNLFVYCGNDDATSVAAYATELQKESNGYHVELKDGIYTAYDDSQTFTIIFTYDSDSKFAIFTVGNYTSWPNIAVSNAIKQIVPDGQDSLPAFAQAMRAAYADYNSNYKELDIELLFKADSYTEDTLAAAKAGYVSTLTSETNKFTTKIVRGEAAYFSEHNEFEVYLSDVISSRTGTKMLDRFSITVAAAEEADLDAWPTASINKFFADNSLMTPLPSGASIESARYFRFESYEGDPEQGTDTRCIIEAYGDGLTYEVYKALLDNAASGYKYLGAGSETGPYYYEPITRADNQVALYPQEGGFAIVVFVRELDPNFPLDKVLEVYNLQASVFPAFAIENAEYWEFYETLKGEKVNVYGTFSTADYATAALTTLYNEFVAMGETKWMNVSTQQQYIFMNADDPDLTVSFSNYSQTEVVVTFNKVKYYDAFPAIEAFSRINLNLPATIAPRYAPDPAIAGAKYVIQQQYSNVVDVVTYLASADDATAAQTAYLEKLATNSVYQYDSDIGAYVYWFSGSKETGGRVLAAIPLKSGSMFVVRFGLYTIAAPQA